MSGIWVEFFVYLFAKCKEFINKNKLFEYMQRNSYFFFLIYKYGVKDIKYAKHEDNFLK
jgi:hypothetical protein